MPLRTGFLQVFPSALSCGVVGAVPRTKDCGVHRVRLVLRVLAVGKGVLVNEIVVGGFGDLVVFMLL